MLETGSPENLVEGLIGELEQQIIESKKKLSELRKQLPKKQIEDYIFTDKNDHKIKLSEMFGDSNELLLVHNMGKSCPYCTLWADEYNGIWQHLESRTPFVVISPDDHQIMKEFAEGRNWNFKIYSSKGNSFKKDVGFENEKGMALPGVSVFTKEDGKIVHYNKAYFGPGDDFCGLWSYLDLLPEGDNNWQPKYKY